MNFLDRLQPLGVLVLRLVLGAIMIAHGFPKAFGGVHHHVDIVRGMGMPGWLAYLLIAAELGGGILLVIGFLTRCAAIAILINMLVAIFGVHFKTWLSGRGQLSIPPGAGGDRIFAVLLRRGTNRHRQPVGQRQRTPVVDLLSETNRHR